MAEINVPAPAHPHPNGLVTVRVAAPARDLVVRDDSVARLIEDWHKALELRVRAQELAKFTASTYRVGMRKFIEWMTSAQISNPDADTVVAWKAEMMESGYKPAAVNIWLSGIKSFYRWAVARKRLAVDITAGVESAQRSGVNQEHARETLTDAEMRRLLAYSEQMNLRDRAMLYLFAYTGARSIELHRANVGDVKNTRGEMTLAVQGKGRFERDELVVVANEDAKTALLDWLAERRRLLTNWGLTSLINSINGNDQPLFISCADGRRGHRLSLSALRTIIKGAYHAVGITDESKTVHSIRHTAITNAIEHGADLIAAQAMARHRKPETTMKYFHNTRRLTEAAEKRIDYNNDQPHAA